MPWGLGLPELSLPPPELQPVPLTPAEAEFTASFGCATSSSKGVPTVGCAQAPGYQAAPPSLLEGLTSLGFSPGGVEVTGIPRGRPGSKAWELKLPATLQDENQKIQALLRLQPPTDAAGWAEFAHAAARRAARANRLASRWRRDAERHSTIGRAAAAQAEMAMLEQRVARQASLYPNEPGLRPLVQFCDQLAQHCTAHPRRSRGRAFLPLRRFCGALEHQLQEARKVQPWRHAQHSGLHLYDSPPAAYPSTPPWLPALGGEPRASVELLDNNAAEDASKTILQEDAARTQESGPEPLVAPLPGGMGSSSSRSPQLDGMLPGTLGGRPPALQPAVLHSRSTAVQGLLLCAASLPLQRRAARRYDNFF